MLARGQWVVLQIIIFPIVGETDFSAYFCLMPAGVGIGLKTNGMKLKFILIWSVWAFLLPTVVKGQEIQQTVGTDSVPAQKVDLLTDTLSTALALPTPAPLFGMSAPGFDGCSPWFLGTYGPMWDLHEGLNAQLGMSVSAAFGKHAPSGIGFGQSANLAYALPLGRGFSAAAGLYVQNMDWGNYHQRDFGISAALGYKINEVVSVYAYGTKSFMPRQQQLPVMGYPGFMENFRDRIGAMAEFKIGENAKIQVSVERGSVNNGNFRTVGTAPEFQSPIHPDK